MRNLHLLRNSASQRSLLLSMQKCLILNEWNTLKETRCFVFTNDLKVYLLDLCGNNPDSDKLILDVTKHIHSTNQISVTGCNYLFNELYILLIDGHMLVCSTDKCEVSIKHLNTDVQQASWSPDFERTVIVNKDDVLSVLSIAVDESETLASISLQENVEERNKFVNVGWGSVETQFRGSEGKLSKSSISETPLENCIDCGIDICWKQNSATFACSYMCKKENVRKIKVFSQDGVLLNITKDIAGLFCPIDWCSSRNLIAAVQKLPNKQVIAFIEENALKHGDFRIADDIKIIGLHWNSNGTILACHAIEGRSEVVQLWTTSNYKWYQKQTLEFSCTKCIQWDLSVPNRLHVILKTGVYRMFEWSFEIDESKPSTSDLSLIAVVSGKNVSFTPFKRICMPPSMPFTAYTANAEVNAVVFPTAPTQEYDDSVIIYLKDNRCVLTKYEDFNVQEPYCFTFDDVNSEIKFITPVEFSAWLWLLPNFLYFSWSRVDGTFFCVADLEKNAKSIVVHKMMKLSSFIVSITNYQSDVVIQLEDGTLFVYQNDQLYPLNFIFLEPCHHILALSENTIIGLSEHRNLYVNETIKWRDVVSFYWKHPFLVLVTMDRQLAITKIDFVDSNINFSQVQNRSIEAKSYLVTIVDDRVILEMERGNLEVIRPRPFSIFKMEKMLNDEEYLDAFKMLRKQRINLNVIFDHSPALFLKNIKHIVKNVTDPMYLSMFVTELENENVAKNMFPWKYSQAKEMKDKVNTICEELVSAIKASNIPQFVSPLIAALMKQGKLTEAANYAIQYNDIVTLCHLADPIDVYKHALAAYDLSCALKIVEHSKLDPSEYLPFIHKLQKTEENYRKFKICDYLENYSIALHHLAECTDDEKFEECVVYIQKHNLYTVALNIFSNKNDAVLITDPRYIKILNQVADFYYDKKLYEEAAILYEKANMEKEALRCYLSSGDWFAAISTLLAEDVTTKTSVDEACLTLYNTLQKKGKFEDAAFVAYTYKRDCEKAVSSYLIAKKYCRAIKVAKNFRDEEILTQTIRPRMLDEVKQLICGFEQDSKTIGDYVTRLMYVREKNKNKENNDEDDRISCVSIDSSDSGSVSSMGSRSSCSSISSSAKRQRRRERKLWNLKEGNPREEPSLLDVIKDIIQSREKALSDFIHDLLKALIMTDDTEVARELKTKYSQFLKFLDRTRNKVWPQEITEEGGFKDIYVRCPPEVNVPKCDIKLL